MLEGAPDVAVTPARQGNQSRRIPLVEPPAVSQRFAAPLTLGVHARQEFRQVSISSIVLAQQQQAVRTRVVVGICDADIGTNQWLDAGSHGLAIELDHAEEVVLVGQGDSRHSVATDGIHERRYPHCRVDKRVFRMHVQVNEGASAHDCNMSRRGAKLRRCSSHGPCRASLSR